MTDVSNQRQGNWVSK